MVAYLLAALAAFVNALTSVLQRIGVEDAPESTTMRLSLMSYAIRRVIWVVGFALMLVTFGLQATALRFGELSVVQPVLTTELLFLLLILGGWFRYRLHWQEWLGALVIVAGLGGFFLAAGPVRRQRHPVQSCLAGGLGHSARSHRRLHRRRPCTDPGGGGRPPSARPPR